MITISRERPALACADGFAVAAFVPSSAIAPARPTAHAHVHGADLAAAPAAITIPPGAPQGNRDEGENAWWMHAATRGAD
jgi:hypothetical protein